MLINRFSLALALALASGPLLAADYKIDPGHSFLVFRTSHLNMSWTYGQFNRLSGEFSHDPENPGSNRISVNIDPASVDTNHAERDKDVRERILNVAKFPEASFVSTGYTGSDEKGVMEGTLTVYGVSKPLKIDVVKTGEGDDPWGNYRVGFSGQASFSQANWGMHEQGSGDAVEFEITIEGVRQ